MKIKLVFEDWRDGATNKSIYGTLEGVRLSLGDFHSGSTFPGEIYLDSEQEETLSRSIHAGAVPIFRLYLPTKRGW